MGGSKILKILDLSMKDGTVLEMELEESVYYAKWSNNGDYIAAWSGIYK